MSGFLRKRLERLLTAERSSHKLAASFCLGTFIAISPTIPFQTPLLFLLSWLFRLNSAVTFTAVYLINNPVTMIPIYILDYTVGVWFFEKVVGLQLIKYNPSWVDSFNAYLSKYIDLNKYLGEGFCLWCLLLGGFLCAALISLLLYPLLKRTLDRMIMQLEKQKKSE